MDTSIINKFIGQLKTKDLSLEQFSVYTQNYTSDKVLTAKDFVQDNSIQIEEIDPTIENHVEAYFNNFSELEKFNNNLYSLFCQAVNELIEIYKKNNFKLSQFIRDIENELLIILEMSELITGKEIIFQLNVQDDNFKKTKANQLYTYPFMSLQRKFAQNFYAIINSLKEESILNHLVPLQSNIIHKGLFFTDNMSSKNIKLVYDELIRQNSIETNITLKLFTDVFNKDISIYKKIPWTGTITYLVEFFTMLMQNEIITCHINAKREDKIKALANTFCKPNSLDFQLSELYKSYKSKNKSRTQKLINELTK